MACSQRTTDLRRRYHSSAKVVPVSGSPSRPSLFAMNALISALSLRGTVHLNWVRRQTCLLAGGKFHQEHIVSTIYPSITNE